MASKCLGCIRLLVLLGTTLQSGESFDGLHGDVLTSTGCLIQSSFLILLCFSGNTSISATPMVDSVATDISEFTTQVPTQDKNFDFIKELGNGTGKGSKVTNLNASYTKKEYNGSEHNISTTSKEMVDLVTSEYVTSEMTNGNDIRNTVTDNMSDDEKLADII